MTDETDLIIITEEEAGERLDKILAKRFTDLYSRSYFQHLIEEQLVLLNGDPVKKRIKPEAGDEIEIEFAALPEANLDPEPMPLEIIYEDEELLAINKPVGMVVHPAPGNWSHTFVNGLLYHCRQLAVDSFKDPLRPGIVHRLDKETSGVLLAAKTTWMQQKLIEQFSLRQIYKEYLAICVGHPGNGQVNAPIGRHPIHRKQMTVLPTGRPAQSFYKTLSSNGRLSIVQVVITTGRTHQIRVHMKYHGTPVLGDPLYGQLQANQQFHAQHQYLHAAVVRFTHPKTGEKIEISAEPPVGMQHMLKKIDPNWIAE